MKKKIVSIALSAVLALMMSLQRSDISSQKIKLIR